MKSRTFFNLKNLMAAAAIICCVQTGMSQDLAENPFIRVDANGDRIFTADPSAHVWADGRLYVYASHDVQPARGCDLMDKYHVFSTDDMVNWTDHGEILSSADVPEAWRHPEGGWMWAPDAAYRNGTYYFYFPHKDGTNTWHIGVATSTEPASGFVIQGYIEGMYSGIDPSVFIDDDGQAYIYQNGPGSCAVGKLKENMMELDGEMKVMQGLENYHEGPWMHKRGEWYYLSYADGHDDGYIKNEMRYAMSKNPMGPWTYKGVVVGGTTEGTQHGSIVEYKGQWYAFYHNNVLSFGTNPGGGARSICVDKLYYNEDGTMRKVVMTGMKPADPVIGVKNIPSMFLAENYTTGKKGETWNDIDDINDGGVYRNDGVDIQACSEGKANIFNIVAGEWLGYRLNVPRNDNYKFEFRISSPEGKGAFHVEVDGVDKTGKLTVPRTGNYQTWASVSPASAISLSAGNRLFKVVADEAGFNFANFVISYENPAPPAGKKITLRAENKYLTFNEQNQLVCDKTSITPECVFTVESSSTGKYVLLKASNGRYVTAKSIKSAVTLETSSSNAAMLLWYNVGTNQIGLKGALINAIICSENGTKPVNCNRYEIGAWEKFTWQEYKDPLSIDAQKVEQPALQVYPIPAVANSSVNVSIGGKDASPVSIQIMDMQGRICKNIEQTYSDSSVIDVPTSGIPIGSYILRVTSSGFSATSKLIII